MRFWDGAATTLIIVQAALWLLASAKITQRGRSNAGSSQWTTTGFSFRRHRRLATSSRSCTKEEFDAYPQTVNPFHGMRRICCHTLATIRNLDHAQFYLDFQTTNYKPEFGPLATQECY